MDINPGKTMRIGHYVITAAVAFACAVAGALTVAIFQFGLLTEVAAEWAAAIATVAAVIVALLAPRIERRAQLKRAQQEDVRALCNLTASCSELMRQVNETISAGQWSEDANVSFLPLLQLSRDTSRRLEIRSVPQREIGPLVYTLRGTIEVAAALAEKAALSLPRQIDPEPMRVEFENFLTLSAPMRALAARHGIEKELMSPADRISK